MSRMVCGIPYTEKTSQRLKSFVFQVQSIKKLGPNKANKKSVTDRDVNVFKVLGNLKK